MAILKAIPRDTIGIYTLGGGRQIGKTTLLKQWMVALLTDGVAPEKIYFVTGELIDSHEELIQIVHQFTSSYPLDAIIYLIIDEVTHIKVGIKGLNLLPMLGTCKIVF